MTLAKGLGNGVPIGCCLAAGEASEILHPGNHGSTFGGNPLACNAASAVIDTMQSANLAQKATETGNYMLEKFRAELDGFDEVKDIRGKGLMIGIELDKPCAELVIAALEKELLINVTADNVIRLLPPLILEINEADRIVNTVSELIKNFLRAS
jgi:acetylornithine aminotransferase